ncbi:MAG: cache domain-containing protein, partial [Humidesulfovibrio sp.]|nr:cache domain-containing protein [Humidesulfovibrio sp.]
MSGFWAKIRQLLTVDLALLPVLTVVLLGAFISTLVVYSYTKNAVQHLAQGQMTHDLKLLNYEVSAQTKNMITQSKFISHDGVLRLALEDSYLGRSARVVAQRKLADYVAGGLFEHFYLMDMHGVIVLASNSALEGVLNISDRQYYKQARAGQPTLETVLSSRVSKRPILVSSHPLRKPDGTMVGVLVAISDTNTFAKDVLTNVRIGKSGQGYILGAGGLPLAQPDWAANDEFLPGEVAKEITEKADGTTSVRYLRKGAWRTCVALRNEITG